MKEKGKVKNEVKHKVTIDEIAIEMGCSKTTVSRALSGKGRISSEMREKVLDYSRKCGYKPNMIAKSLADSKTYNVGVILPSDQELNEIPFFQNCLLGICEVAAEGGYDALVTTVEDNDIFRLQNVIEKKKVDAVILTRTLQDDIAIAYLKESGVPFLVVGSCPDQDVTQVDNHHREACRELTSMLCMQHPRRMAFIGGDQRHIVSQNRYKGYQEGMELNKVKPDPKMVFLNCNTKASVNQAVEKILEAQADCILCMDDKICSQVLVKLDNEHLSIPKDIKVASFYDSVFLQSHNPAITTLQFDEKELGRVACKAILDQLEGKEIQGKTYLTYDVVMKPSTRWTINR